MLDPRDPTPSPSRDDIFFSDEPESELDTSSALEYSSTSSRPVPLAMPQARKKSLLAHIHPRPPPTPNTANEMSAASSVTAPAASHLGRSSPTSPPTPAPSPTPRNKGKDWLEQEDREMLDAAEDVQENDTEEGQFEELLRAFRVIDVKSRKDFLTRLIDTCDSSLLSYAFELIGSRLRKDPFMVLPNELCFRVLEFVDDPRTFVRASQVSRRWRDLLSDDQSWKTLWEKYAYAYPASASQAVAASPRRQSLGEISVASTSNPDAEHNEFIQAANHVRRLRTQKFARLNHRSLFKHQYMVEQAWKKGGTVLARHVSNDHGVVTTLHLTKKYIVIALDNSKIHVFDVKGNLLRTLSNHQLGVWAMVIHEDTIVSGGCDRDIRVTDASTGEEKWVLRGHTSTVRCLKLADPNTVISGSRDHTVRIWDLQTGTVKKVLSGHAGSVRCLDHYGDIIVSGSYDTKAMVWRMSTGEHIWTLEGHFSQIYVVAFDGKRIATGSLDTSVRIWDVATGHCVATLQGHTSLVGQVQIKNHILVTGGSDGSVRVWSLDKANVIHRIAAHDNSVTSLQVDDTRIMSGGSDGRVKIWDLKTGSLVRELSQPSDSVWRVAFEDEKAVIMSNRNNKTFMEVWDFSPPDSSEEAIFRNASTPAVVTPSILSDSYASSEFEMIDANSEMANVNNWNDIVADRLAASSSSRTISQMRRDQEMWQALVDGGRRQR